MGFRFAFGSALPILRVLRRIGRAEPGPNSGMKFDWGHARAFVGWDGWSVVESSLKIAEFFVFFSIVGAIIFYLFTFGFSHLFDVVLGSEGLRVVLFRKIDIATISYRSIERAERRWIFLSPDASAPWSLVLPITNRTGLRGII